MPDMQPTYQSLASYFQGLSRPANTAGSSDSDLLAGLPEHEKNTTKPVTDMNGESDSGDLGNIGDLIDLRDGEKSELPNGEEENDAVTSKEEVWLDATSEQGFPLDDE